MNEREFCYWLQGLLELSDIKTLDEKQVKIIRDHLTLVFNKVTPFVFPTLPTLPYVSPPNSIINPDVVCSVASLGADYPVSVSC